MTIPTEDTETETELADLTNGTKKEADPQTGEAPPGSSSDNFSNGRKSSSRWKKFLRAVLLCIPNHVRMLLSFSYITPEVLNYKYAGEGTTESPYVVEFHPNDPRNPQGFSVLRKWMITLLMALATLAVSFTSSAYSGGAEEVISDFGINEEVFTLGISLYVLGFALGPVIWAPLSEMYGRQILFFFTFGLFVVFVAVAAASPDIEALLIFRFFAGAFGSSPLANAGGVIADMFPANQRGLALAVYAAAPLLGPAVGPIVGGFVGESLGWRWVAGIEAIISGVTWIICVLLVPETYAPVLLQRRAWRLTRRFKKVYRSKIEIQKGVQPSLLRSFRIALSRPWLLLFVEPIVLLLSIYMAFIYGTLYMLFAAFPIVFQQDRGWSEGIGGLAFIGVAVGCLLAVVYIIGDNYRYKYCEKRHQKKGERGAPPEARLPPCMVGAIFIPVGLFWFAWTNYTSIHWSVCIIASSFFGFGLVLVFLSVMNYLVDSYTIYAASALAANSLLRAFGGVAFPLFTTYMYDGLGIHWASSVPGFLALACLPFPFLFYIFGSRIRKVCKYAKQAQNLTARSFTTTATPSVPIVLEEGKDNKESRADATDNDTTTETEDHGGDDTETSEDIESNSADCKANTGDSVPQVDEADVEGSP